jgi:hypothetical protein
LIKKKPTSGERAPLLQSETDINAQEPLAHTASTPTSPTKIVDLLKDRNLLIILISYSLLSFQVNPHSALNNLPKTKQLTFVFVN